MQLVWYHLGDSSESPRRIPTAEREQPQEFLMPEGSFSLEIYTKDTEVFLKTKKNSLNEFKELKVQRNSSFSCFRTG